MRETLPRRKGLIRPILLSSLTPLCALGVALNAYAQEVDVPEVDVPEVDVPEVPATPPPAAPPPAARRSEPAPPPAPAAVAATAEDEEETENIVVTGSRIARSSLTSYGNIAVVDSEQIKATGAVTVDDLLRRLPSVSLQGTTVNANNGGQGFRTVDLRNLESSRTLVLVNGRRYIQQGTIFATQFVDVNDIPVPLIDRVEILFDGASAIYGSDAVAGVINFVLKDEFEGLEVEVQTGISGRGDGEQLTVSVTGGVSNARGNFVVSANYAGYESVDQTARDYGLSDTIFAIDDNTFFFGSSAVPDGRVGGTSFRNDDETGRSFQSFRSAGIDQRYNFSDAQFLFGKQDRFQIHGFGKYEMIDSINLTMEGFMETNFIHRTTRTQLAPQPIFGEVSVDASLLPEDYRATLAPGTQSVAINKRMVEVGNRIQEFQSLSMRQLLGIRGEIAEFLNYEVFGQYTRNRFYGQLYNSIDVAKANETGDPNSAFCQANDCRSLWTGAGNLSPAAANHMRFTSRRFTADEMIQFSSVLGAEIFALPTTNKMVAASIGYEYRRMYGSTSPDSIVVRGDSAGNASSPLAGDFDSNEVFAEVLIPIASDMFLVHDFGVDAAVRVSNYSGFGTETTFRTRARYAPIQDLALRATFSTAFRAPNVGELFSGQRESFETLTDPCSALGPDADPTVVANCAADGVPTGYRQADSQISTNIGGNPNLTAETSESFDLGVILTSGFLGKAFGQFSATFDFYGYTVNNAVGTAPGQTALDLCYESSGLSSEFCDLITRDATGAISDFQLTNQNLGKLETAGMDFGLAYAANFADWGMGEVGQLSLSWDANYLLYFENTPFEGADVIVSEGTADPSNGIYPKLSWRLSALYGIGDFSVGAFLTYIDGMDRFNFEDDEPFNTVGEIAYTDLSITYRPGAFSLTAGVNNLTDESPPFITGGAANSSAQGYDFLGRYFFLRGKYTF